MITNFLMDFAFKTIRMMTAGLPSIPEFGPLPSNVKGAANFLDIFLDLEMITTSALAMLGVVFVIFQVVGSVWVWRLIRG